MSTRFGTAPHSHCSGWRAHSSLALALCSVLVAACGATDATSPAVATPVALPAAIARLALTVDVATGGASANSAVSPSSMLGGATTFGSLLGVDGVAVEVGRVDRSVLGQFAPGKVRVMVRLRLRNALDRTVLLSPTLPSPPAGDGIYLFAVQSVAVESPGGVSVSGNTVIVESPSHGSVIPGPEWEGAAYDYLRGPSSSCVPSSSTCARWERFAAPIAAGGTTEWRTVSYDIDPTVHHMRLRFIVAADLANAGS